MASDDNVNVVRVKCLLHLLPQQPCVISAVFAAAGAIQWPVARCDDERVAVAARLLQVAPQPRCLGCIDISGVKLGLGVDLQEVDGAHAETVVHSVVCFERGRRPKLRLVGAEIVPNFVVAGCHHVRHDAGDTLNFSEKGVPVRHVAVGI